MIRTALVIALAATAFPASAIAAEPAKPAATAPAAKAKYTSADTNIGTLLDDPAAKAIIDKHIPGMTSNEQIEMARSMTLKAIQTYAPDDVTDERLAKIDAELANLK
jgi:para-nitrobenzyl esterase